MEKEALIQNPSYHDLIDAVEAEMERVGTIEFEVSDFFCGGMYIRTVYIPKDSYLTSKIHKKDHTFILTQGSITIFTEGGGEETFESPYMGITPAGTRRFARANEDCLWTTHHRTDKMTVEEVEQEIIENRINPLLMKNQEVLQCRGS